MNALVSAMLVAAIGLAATVRDVGGQQPNAVAPAPDYWTYGSGTDSCGQWVQNKRVYESRPITETSLQSAIAYKAEVEWVNGYVSAVGVTMAALPQPVGLAETDGAAIKAWMDNYCADHPLDEVSYGAAQLVAELWKRKREAGQAPVSAAQRGAPTGDRWVLTITKDPMTASAITRASVKADAPVSGLDVTATPLLTVRCKQPEPDDLALRMMKASPTIPAIPGLDVYVTTGMAANVENADNLFPIEIRFDSGTVKRMNTTQSTDKNSLFFPKLFPPNWVAGMSTLVKSSRVLFKFTPFNASPVIATFTTQGFDRHVAEVLKACPPFDASKWDPTYGDGY
jgi:hypothetical protein